MAVVIPFIAIVAGGVAVGSAVAAGVITVAAIAGAAAIVSGVASLAGKPKLAKIAGIIGLAAGAYSMVAGGASGASAGIDNMNAAAPGEASGAIEGSLAASRAQPIEAMTGTAGDTAAANAPSITENMTTQLPQEAASPGVVDTPQPMAPPARSLLSETLDPYGPPSSAMNGLAGPPSSAMTGLAGPPSTAAASPVQDTFLNSLKNVGKVLQDNKELVKLGGGMLEGAFGPEAQKMSIYRQQLEFQKMLAERQNANANNLVGLRLPQLFNPNAPPLRRV